MELLPRLGSVWTDDLRTPVVFGATFPEAENPLPSPFGNVEPTRRQVTAPYLPFKTDADSLPIRQVTHAQNQPLLIPCVCIVYDLSRTQ